ncbi:MAG: FkbM family methyltransferase [Candidatus Magasanikbacteria bacterium]
MKYFKNILNKILYQFYHRIAFLFVSLFSKDKITYAQNKEDQIIDILTGFKDTGSYIDIGANNPHKISVTKKFYERGWSGINIEPNSDNYLLFLKDRPRDINLNIGLAGQEGELDYYYKPNATLIDSTGFTFSKKVYNERKYDLQSKKIKVSTLSKIFSDNNLTHIDFINMDVEGFENEILSGNNWSKYGASVLCIEGKNYDQFLSKYGYKKVLYDGSNIYYIQKKR